MQRTDKSLKLAVEVIPHHRPSGNRYGGCLMPNTEDALQDLHWHAQETRANGGDAILAAAGMSQGPSGDELVTRLGDYWNRRY